MNSTLPFDEVSLADAPVEEEEMSTSMQLVYVSGIASLPSPAAVGQSQTQ